MVRSVASYRTFKIAKSFSFCLMRAAALNLEQKTLTSRPLSRLRRIHVACIAKVQLLPRLSRQVGMSVQAESECIYLSLISRKNSGSSRIYEN